MVVTGLLGLAFERIIIMPVYGQHLKQILITMGGLIVAEQLINVFWGPTRTDAAADEPARRDPVGDVAIEKFRLLAVAVGLVGVRRHAAGPESHQDRAADPRRRREPRDGRGAGLPHPRLFVAVFVAGSALAGLGGAMWGLYRETVTAAIGGEMIVLVFIVIIIGGLGSVGGCFIGALLVALVANYTGYLAPKVALVPTSC